MQHQFEFTAQEVNRLHTECQILSVGAADLYTQYQCDVNMRALKDIKEAYEKSRTEAIKKHGELLDKDDASKGHHVPQYKKQSEEDIKAGKEPEETEGWKAFNKEFKPIQEAKHKVSLEVLEIETFRKQNTDDMKAIFRSQGFQLGVFGFSLIFRITDAEVKKLTEGQPK